MREGESKGPAAYLSGWGRDFRVATILLTRLPLRHDGEITSIELSRSGRAFPIVGGLVGWAGAVAYTVIFALGLGPWLAALAAVTVTVLLTGALHEDGLADVADGFGGGRDVETKLAIMKDSRLGAYGGLALIFSVGVRVAALATLAEPVAVVTALIAAHAVSRGAIPVVMKRYAAAREDGLGSMAGTPSRQEVAMALTLSAIFAIAFLGPLAGPLALALAALVTWLVSALARRQIGGYTGDVLGALEQSVEIAVLIAAVVVR